MKEESEVRVQRQSNLVRETNGVAHPPPVPETTDKGCTSHPSKSGISLRCGGGVSMFREQVNTIAAWFDQWNECERTVALYSLLKRLSPAKCRFLALALDHSLAECGELHQTEIQANNPTYICSILSLGCDGSTLRQLLQLLPLLRPGNSEAKSRYLAAIHSALGHAVETGAYVEEARQLLSYALIHPAINNGDRKSLTQWLRHLEDRIANGPSAGGVAGAVGSCKNLTESSPVWTTGANVQVNGQNSKTRRSNSLTPPVTVSRASELWSSQDDLTYHARNKPRSFSLSSDHAPPLSPQSSLASSGSGSESQLEDNISLQQGPDPIGMRDVPAWLKSLRLHKYVNLFSKLTYEEMMALTEEWLAARGVTKGARHKIVMSVRKLQERGSLLRQVEREVSEGNGTTLGPALDELKTVLTSPLKPQPVTADDLSSTDEDEVDDSDADVPTLFTRCIGKVCSKMVATPSGRTDPENAGQVLQLVWLLDRAVMHDAFSPQHKRRLAQWRNEIQEAWRSVPLPEPSPPPPLPPSPCPSIPQQPPVLRTSSAKTRWQNSQKFGGYGGSHSNGYCPRNRYQQPQSHPRKGSVFSPTGNAHVQQRVKRPPEHSLTPPTFPVAVSLVLPASEAQHQQQHQHQHQQQHQQQQHQQQFQYAKPKRGVAGLGYGLPGVAVPAAGSLVAPFNYYFRGQPQPAPLAAPHPAPHPAPLAAFAGHYAAAPLAAGPLPGHYAAPPAHYAPAAPFPAYAAPPHPAGYAAYAAPPHHHPGYAAPPPGVYAPAYAKPAYGFFG